TQTVTFSMSYNFTTNAYQKAYFMDRERYRAYVRENIDPLTQFGVKDKMPKAIFTNGPVEIGMKVEPLIPVANEYTVLPAISLTLSNRQQIEDKEKKVITKWDGKIKNIRELILLLPPGITIHEPDQCTPAPFEEYTKGKCEAGCQDDYKMCLGSCREKEDCKMECNRLLKNCQDECGFLFQVEGSDGEEYKAYALNIKNIKIRDQNKDIDKFLTFTCRILPTPEALDNTPLTARYFRVRAKYNYFLENSIQVVVEATPTIGGTQAVQGTVVLPRKDADGSFIPLTVTSTPMLNPETNEVGKREKEYNHIIYSAAQAYGVDYLLIKAIIQAESTWNPDAEKPEPTKKDYSVGLMQILTSTAESQGCISSGMSQDNALIALKNPVTNINCGARYLAFLIDYQKKNELKTGLRNIAGGYNGGQGTMEVGKNTMGGLTIWEDGNNLRYAGTREYVNKVMTYYNKLLDEVDKVKAPQMQQGSSRASDDSGIDTS
ncbi:MAG: transglycosylase SLT domain-containing protein, partial [Candidatus Aenigmarchaeota archaeon]|nr:transglycosylase SLT domain-containing protein [Candidatus Aenigmarchaeota archaeon]